MILTERLILRPLHVRDGRQIAAAVNETWDDLSQWMRWTARRNPIANVRDTKNYARICHKAFKQQTDFVFGGFLKDGGELALIMRLYPREKAIGYYAFGGYWVRKKYQSQGLMREAVHAGIDFGFHTLAARRLEIVVAATNEKSIAVIKHCGFAEEARLKLAHRLPNDTAVDELVFTRFN